MTAGEELREKLAAFGAGSVPEKEEKLEKYRILLAEWNSRVNLTAITDPEEVRRKHFLDSLTFSAAAEPADGNTLLDVGSGAGLPGIPLAVAFPALKVTLLETLQKRCRFLEEVKAQLGLDNVTVLQGRAEDLARDPAFRGTFDLVTARAVAPLGVLAEYCLPFVRTGGLFVAYKSRTAEEELAAAANAVTTLGGSPEGITACNIGGDVETRALVRIRKTAETPEKYPRRAGIPAKRPL